jgi:predicted phosphodiesterase
MKLLAFSDIHNNMAAVRELRRQESNGYNDILVAGDIGGESVSELQSMLSPFNYPMYFV